jgi:hypothetical protein
MTDDTFSSNGTAHRDQHSPEEQAIGQAAGDRDGAGDRGAGDHHGDGGTAGDTIAAVNEAAQQENAAKPKPRATAEQLPAGRMLIVVAADEHRVIADATAAIARRDTDIYQRGGKLVRIAQVARPPIKRLKCSGAPHIEPAPLPDIRTRVTRCAVLVQPRGQKMVKVSPPKWLPSGIAAQSTPWDGIRPLELVTETPLLRPDGTILQTPGYDLATGILYLPSATYGLIPLNLTFDDAIAARDLLLKVVCDVPFGAAMHRAAWLSSVLTPLARAAFDGPAPLFLVDANVRGCGKGLTASCASIIASGRPFAVAIYSHDPVEMQKSITAIAQSGERMVMFDNVAGAFGNSTLDAALTTMEWQCRTLGRTEQPRVPLICTWYATGNNPVIAADTSRRICNIHIESPEERPEERTGFQHANLLDWVRAERAQLLRAALMILAAYCRAGRPQARLTPWGSFEAWSDLVRQAVVWLDLPDPADTRVALARTADSDVAKLQILIAVWQAIVPEGEYRTAADILNTIKKQPDERKAQHDALMIVCPGRELPTSQHIGTLLRTYRGRFCGGVCFRSRQDTHTKVSEWGLTGAS